MSENKHYELHADYIVPVYDIDLHGDPVSVELVNTYDVTGNLRMALWAVRAVPGRELETMRASILSDQSKYDAAFNQSRANEYLRFYRDCMIKLLKIIDDKSTWKNPEANIENVAETGIRTARYNADMRHAVYAERIMPRTR